MTKIGGMQAAWRSRARVIAAIGVLSLMATMVTTAPYSIDAQAATVDTADTAEASDLADAASTPEEATSDAAELIDADEALGFAATVAQDDTSTQPPTSAGVVPESGEPSEGDLQSVPAIDPGIPAADLTVEISAERDPVLSESFFSYYVEVTNNGPVEAENVVVTNTLPDFMSFIALSGCWLANDTFPECHLNEIPAGESRTYEVLVLVGPGVVGEHDFAVSATSETLDPDPTNNEATFTSTVNIRATWRQVSATVDLTVAKIDLVDPVPALGEITYRITVANAGPSAAVGVEVTDTLPTGVTLVSTSGCRGNSGVPVCELGTIPPRQTKSYDVIVSADPGTVGEITNAVSVATRSNDIDDTNNTDTETTTIEFGTIILEKQTDPDGSTQTFAFSGDLQGDIGDGETLELTNLLAGTYTTTEIAPAGWGIADITCDDTDSGGDTTTGEVTFVITGDEIVRCVVTNALLGSVTIDKATLGIDGTFGFDGDLGAFDLTTTANTATTTFTDLLPGAYSVTEDDPSTAFYLTGLDCVDDDGGSTGDIATRTASIDLDAGEAVTCTFTNSEAGSVTIDKTTIGADGTFEFSGDLGAASITTVGNTGTATITGIAPGTHTLTEDSNEAYELTALSCVDPDGETTTDLAGATATIDIDPGENVTCSFENTELGTIIVEKQTLPDGDPQTFEFAGDASGSIADDGTITVEGLLPGTHTATEDVPTGWALTDITCDDGGSATASTGDTGTATATFEIEPGEVVTCVFTNTKDGRIVIEKQTLPDGDPQTFDFGSDVVATLADGDTASEAVAPGTYTSTETVPAGWALTDITCDDGGSATASSGDTGTATATFEIEPGETVTCVFTNTKLSTIIVEKQTDPDAIAATYDFTGDVAGTIGDGQTITVTDLVPGTYTSTEADPTPAHDLTNILCDDGGSLTPSTGDVGARTATFNVDPGETITCVFTNTQRGTIIVEQQTLPDPTAGNFSYTGDAAGTIADNGTITVGNLVPGTYTSTQSAFAAGVDLSAIVCDDGASANASSGDVGTATATFQLDPGETITCVFTNSQRGTIVVEKQTLPNGATGSFAFTGDAAGTISDGGTLTVGNLVPGIYTSTETDPTPGFDLTDIGCIDSATANSSGDTGTATATFVLDPGETVTCTFTNTQRATLRVATLTDPANQPGSFGYSGAITATHNHGSTTVLFDRIPGQYTVTQSSAPAGLPLSDISCSDGNSTGDVGTSTATFELEPGEDVTCTFTNSVPGSITILKNTVAGNGVFSFTGDLGAFDLDTTGTGTASMTFSDVEVGSYDVTESDPDPAVLTGLACNDGGSATPSTTSLATRTATIEVEANESITCTFTNSFNLPPAITGGPTAAVSVDENQTAVTDVESTDSADSEGSGLTYSLTGGADAGFFSIAPNTGVLTFTTAPDFEAMADADGNNVYEVQVTVTDSGGLTDFQDISVTLLDVNDAPVVTTSAGTTAFTEGSGAVTVDGAVTVVDQDGGNLASATVTITNLQDGGDEVLACGACGGIASSYSAGVLTLTGADSVANYQAALRSVTYNHASLNPTELPDRVISFVVNDGTVDSVTDTKTVSVTAVNSPPTAVDDAYTVPVNVVLDAGASSAGAIEVEDADGVLTKGTDDSDPEGSSLSVTGIVGCGDSTAPFTGCATTGGGTVTMNADGTFTYLSQPGETDATDTFTYTLSDGVLTDTGTVTITFGDTIWFLDAAAAAGGNGTSNSPFDTVASFNSSAADGAGDIIYVTGGTYTDAGFSLMANQQLIGATIGLTSGNLTIAPSGGAAPTISSSTGQIVIFLGANNSVRGFTSAGSLGGASIVGTNFGTPTIDNFTINGPGGLLELTNGDLSNIALGSMTTSSSNLDGIDLNNVTGTFDVTAPVSISGTSGQGIDIRNSSATINFSSTVDITNSGAAGVLLTNNTGTITFADLDVNNSTSNQPGIVASGGGTLNITTGTVNSGTASAVDINGVALGVTLSSVSSSGGTAPGIELRSTSGSFSANGGTIANKNGADLAAGAKSPTGEGIGVYIDGASNVTLSGMTINGTMQNFGIRGFGLSGTTNFTNLTMNGTYGTTAISDEGAVVLNDVSGTFNVTGGSYGGGHEDTFAIANTAGSLVAEVTNVDFNTNQPATGDEALEVRTISPGTGTLTLSVQGNRFNGARARMLFVDLAGSGGGTVNVGSIAANTFTQGQTNLSSGGAIEVLASGTGNTSTVSMNIANNVITAGSNTFEGDPVVLGNGFGFAGTTNVRFTGNRIGIDGANGSAVNPTSGQGDSAVVVTQNGTGTMNALIDNNQIFDWNASGIEVFYNAEGPASPSGGTINVVITNNTITEAVGGGSGSIEFIGDHDVDTCMHVAGNSLNNPTDREIVVDSFQAATSTFQVQGYSDGPLAADEDDLEVFWAAANGGLVPDTDVKVFTLDPAITGVASCPTPP